jgi:hypothetical protein
MQMNRKLILAISAIALLIGSTSLRAQSTFGGQITPSVSTRSNVDAALGAPVKQDNATDFEYTPPTGAQSLMVGYDATGVVSYVTTTFLRPVSRAGMVQAMGLPSQTQPTNVVQGQLTEFFGAPAFVVFVYVSGDVTSGVITLRYDSAAAFAGEVPGGGPASATPSPAPSPAPVANGTPIAPDATPLPAPANNNGSAGPGMWQRQQTVPNQPWTVCGNSAPTALASFGYGVNAVKDPRGNLRIFYSSGGGPNSAVINCSWVSNTALYTITSASVNGISDAQNVANQLFAYMFSTPGNAAPAAPAAAGQIAAPGNPVVEQKQQGIANQSVTACEDAAQKALASLNYSVSAIPDDQGAQTIFYGVGSDSSAAIIGCSGTPAMAVYTITGASVKGTQAAENVATCLHSYIFSPGTADLSCTAAPAMQAMPMPGVSVPAAPSASSAPMAAAAVPAELSSVLQPLSAMRGHNFTLKLLTPISSASSNVGDAVSLQVMSNDASNGAMVSGAIDRVGCTTSGMFVCVLDFSMDHMIYNGQSIPVVGNLFTLVNSKGWPHVDEEGNVVTPGGNYRDAILSPSMAAAINHTTMAPHPAVFTEITANGPTISFGAGSLFTVDLNSDLGWP